MKKVIILKGLPASGKSTWAKQMVDKKGYKRINKDDLRAMLDNGKWSKANEKMVLAMRDHMITHSLEAGFNVIIDDTNLHPKHEARIRELAGEHEVEVKFFECSVAECVKRDLIRPVSVGEKVIRRMYEDFLRPKAEQYVPRMDKPTAYIFDVDGTLAKMHSRGAYDWGKVHTDKVNLPVRNILHTLKKEGHKIIIFTGRDKICFASTVNWLSENEIDFNEFHMRPIGNTEKDSIIKKGMFDEVKHNYNILGVFDDRDSVVEMWRSIGLTCFQVDYGDF